MLAEAQDAAAQELPASGTLPEHGRPSIAPVDMRELPFVTVDPPSSMDLDQAAYLTRGSDGGEEGYTIYYAIACLAFMVRPGGPLDTEVRERGTSISTVRATSSPCTPRRSRRMPPPCCPARTASHTSGRSAWTPRAR